LIPLPLHVPWALFFNNSSWPIGPAVRQGVPGCLQDPLPSRVEVFVWKAPEETSCYPSPSYVPVFNFSPSVLLRSVGFWMGNFFPQPKPLTSWFRFDFPNRRYGFIVLISFFTLLDLNLNYEKYEYQVNLTFFDPPSYCPPSLFYGKLGMDRGVFPRDQERPAVSLFFHKPLISEPVFLLSFPFPCLFPTNMS